MEIPKRQLIKQNKMKKHFILLVLVVTLFSIKANASNEVERKIGRAVYAYTAITKKSSAESISLKFTFDENGKIFFLESSGVSEGMKKAIERIKFKRAEEGKIYQFNISIKKEM